MDSDFLVAVGLDLDLFGDRFHIAVLSVKVALGVLQKAVSVLRCAR
jgi:hypothetical protein